MENSKDKKLIITPLDESTKKLSQVLANDTCRKILNLIAEEPLTSSLISERLNVPLSTVEAGIDRLANVGLITVHHRRWSPKGKKVNYYAPAEKYILIAPKAQPDKIFKALKSLLPAVGILAVVSGALDFLYNGMQKAAFNFASAPPAYFKESAEKAIIENISRNVTSAEPSAGAASGVSLPVAAAPEALPAADIQHLTQMAPTQSFLIQHPGIIIFIIGAIVILLYGVYKYKFAKQ